MNKFELRKEYKLIRNNIKDIVIKDSLIFNKLNKLNIFNKYNVVAIYLSFNNEVNTSKIISSFLSNNKQVVIPKIKDDDLVFTYFNGENSNLVKNKYGIYEVKDKEEQIVDDNQIDLIIVPSICCNIFKYRIGYGKGYYDRYLKNKKMTKISLCYDELISDIPFQDENDVKMNIIISDKRIID